MTRAKKLESVSTAQLREALRKHYAAPAYALLEEVRSHTGHRGGTERYADAIAMSLWPSRGLSIHGIEIKASRSDWIREREDPEKAERIAKHCDRWILVTGPGVVLDLGEVPPAWGWLEYGGGKLHTRREGQQRTDVAPITRDWLASLLRRAAESQQHALANYVPRASLEEEIEKRVEGRVAGEVSDAVHRARQESAREALAMKQDAEWARELARHLGIEVGSPIGRDPRLPRSIGRLAQHLSGLGEIDDSGGRMRARRTDSMRRRLEGHARELDHLAQRTREALDALAALPPPVDAEAAE